MTLFGVNIPWDFHCGKIHSVRSCRPSEACHLNCANIWPPLKKENLIKTETPAADMDHIDRASAVVIPEWMCSFLCGLWCCHDYRHDVNIVFSGMWSERRRLTWSVFTLQESPGLDVTLLLQSITQNIHNIFISRNKPNFDCKSSFFFLTFYHKKRERKKKRNLNLQRGMLSQWECAFWHWFENLFNIE